jgi:midasin (ATPase involved in ribosome maturation)
MTTATEEAAGLPDMKVSVRQVFGIDSNLEVPAYSEPDSHVPDVDPDYLFDRQTTLAILAGFAHNRRVIVTGYHGTGKSTHIEQVAARLNWPCVRVNLDSHISRIDLIGKDAIVIKEGQQSDQAAPVVSSVRDRQYGRARRHFRPLSRHTADQPGPDGSMVDRHNTQLPAARQRGRDRAREGEALSQ